jgi:hypothetical protein
MSSEKASLHQPAGIAWAAAIVAVLLARSLPAREKPVAEGGAVGVHMAEPKTPSILVQRGAEGWKRVQSGGPILANEPLVSLPGYASAIRLPSGVRLLLWGHVPELSRHPLMDFLLDSAVSLRKNPDFDADVTLLRGRVFLSTTRAPVKVRLRFDKEIWDLTLTQTGTEVGLDLLRQYTPDSNWRGDEEPRTEMYLCILKGKADLKYGAFTFNNLQAPPGTAVFLWDNGGGRPAPPQRIDTLPAIWSKNPPVEKWARAAEDVRRQLREAPPKKGPELQAFLNHLREQIKKADAIQAVLEPLSKSIPYKTPVAMALMEAREPTRDQSQRLLSIYALGAIDEVGQLLDVLGSASPHSGPDREAAILGLRRWLSRGPEQSKLLYSDAGGKKTGLLLAGKRFSPGEADRVLTLLHDFNSVDSQRKETFELLIVLLGHKQLAIRELARWHLARLAKGVDKLPAFDAASSPEERAKAIKEWEKLVETGSLPPRTRPE